MIVKRFNYTHAKIERCIDEANRLLKSPVFKREIEEKRAGFDMSTATPEYIADRITSKYGHLICEVHLYHNRWSRALAYFDPRYPNRIYINAAKLNRTDGSVIATIIHEWVHLVDYDDHLHSYGHGSNSPVGKQNTAPYWIDNKAQALIDGQEDYNNNESSRIKVSFWGRVKNWLVFWR